MPRVLVVIFALILLCVGLLAGGCSLVFTGFAFGGGTFLIWITGLVVAAFCLWAAYRLLRGPRLPTPLSAPPHSPSPPPPPPVDRAEP
jgi:hypothetical protein